MGAGKFGHPGWHEDPEWKGAWGPNPPFHTPVFVLTHHTRPPIEMEGGTTFHFLDASPAEALETAREAADGKDVRIGGGPTVIRDFLAAGLVDHMHIVVVPILLGRGVRLWDGLEGLEKDYEVEAGSLRHRVRNRSLHVHVPRRVHRRAQRADRQRARRRRGPPARVGADGWRRPAASARPPTGVNGQVVDEFMSTGAVVAGRGTFEPAGGWGGDHHDGVPIFILSRQRARHRDGQWPLVTYVNDVRTAMAEAKQAAGDKDVLVHGAGIAQLALAAGVLDELEIHRRPGALRPGPPPLRQPRVPSRSSWSAPGSSRARTASPTCTTASGAERPRPAIERGTRVQDVAAGEPARAGPQLEVQGGSPGRCRSAPTVCRCARPRRPALPA